MRVLDRMLLSILTVAIAIGCAQKVDYADSTDGALVGEFEVIISATQADDPSYPETRTEVENWNKVYWLPGDKISVFSAGEMGEFVSQITERALSTTFQGKISVNSTVLDNGDWIYALYPYDSRAVLQGSAIMTSLPAVQVAVAEGVADDLLATAARSRDPFVLDGGIPFNVASSGVETSLLTINEGSGLIAEALYCGAGQPGGPGSTPDLTIQMHFDHICSGLRFCLTQKDVERITLTANGGQPLAGDYSFIWDENGLPVVTAVSNPSSSITLMAPGGGTFKKGVWYCFVTLPAQLSQGLTFTLEAGEKTGTRVISSAVNLKRGAFSRATDMDKDVELVEPIPDLLNVNSTLPVLYINTPNNAPITSKEVWLEEAHAYLKDSDGTVTGLGKTSIRGRGNSTWFYRKKPYAIKLDKKATILGMSNDKRWDLLANYLDHTRLRNDIALEMGRRLTGLAWTPKGRFVELVINGVHHGNYYLVEHIKISKERVNIKEMKSTDVTEPEVTGGYLMELSIEFDEVNKFATNVFRDLYPGAWGNSHTGNGYYSLPVMIKEPDDDVMVPEQLDWIEQYFNGRKDAYSNRITLGIQGLITGNQGDEWRSMVDVDSFIDWMFVNEVVGNGEPLHPKSCYMYKDREGKLCMGPLWDFDYNTFNNRIAIGTIFSYSLWYGYMFRDPVFVARAKERWPAAKAAFLDVANSYVSSVAFANMNSVVNDWRIWGSSSGQDINGDENMDYVTAASNIITSIRSRVASMDAIFGQ